MKFKYGAYAAVAVAAICAFEMLRYSGFYIIQPGECGVEVTLGKINSKPLGPGFGFKLPFITDIRRVNVRQNTSEVLADCFSSDLQQVKLKLKVLYRIPETSAISVVRDYSGDPFEQLIVPRVQEAVKEVTAQKTAAEIVKTREGIKVSGLEGARHKIGNFLVIEDLVIEDVALSKELEAAIEAKMVQQQETEKALFKQQQAETDAKTSIIKAKADAESIRIQGDALQKNPRLVDLKMVEKWDGHAPQVLGGSATTLMPMPSGAAPAP
ncbi:prohibitin family protein [bacterium]|nr:prohibitin family protein [bacterium]